MDEQLSEKQGGRSKKVENDLENSDIAMNDNKAKNLKNNISEVLSKLQKIKLKCDQTTPVPCKKVSDSHSSTKDNKNKAQESVEDRIKKEEKKLQELKASGTASGSKTRIRKKQRVVKQAQSDEAVKQIEEKAIARSSRNSESSIRAQSASSSVKITPENLLISNLLSMSDSERQRYLTKIAKERRILITVNGSLIINPALNHLKFHRNLQSNFPLREMVKKTRTRPRHQRNQGITKKYNEDDHDDHTPKINYSSEVNKIIEDINEKYKTKFALNFIGDNPESNLFYEIQENVEILDNVVDEMVKANTGYEIDGELRINSRNSQQAFVINPRGGRDVFFPSIILRKYALQGDIVKAFVLNDNYKTLQDKSNDDEVDGEDAVNKVTGFVTKIIDRVHTRKCIGSFVAHRKDAKYIVFLPRDMKLPTIRIYPEHWPQSITIKNVVNVSATIFLAEIIYFNCQYAVGKILEEVGPSGELLNEIRGIIMQHNLNITPYTDELKKSVPKLPFIIPEAEINKREDLRKQCVFTIDPLTARDLDDAVSLRELANGNYEIGVHISDVTYFLEEYSPVDDIAKEKTTSVYMIDKVYHMLPETLCMLCSLLPNEDKLTFSVFWEMTKTADIISTRFGRTVINSSVQLAYEHAQALIENPTKVFDRDEMPDIMNGYTINDIRNIVNKLFDVSTRLREKRFANGALRIDQPKLYFDIDPESGKPNGYSIYELKDSNRLIEDFMILANQSVAEFIYSKLPDISILRNHFAPLENLLTNLQSLISTMNFKFDGTSSKSIRESITKILQDCKNPDATKCVLNVLSAKTMTRARYFCSDRSNTELDLKHYALSIPIYTHFTSPIRRYPDILVHRVLSAALNYTELPTRSKEDLRKIVNNSNIQKYNAKLAEDDCSNLFFLNYIKSIGSKMMLGAVFVVNKFYMEVVLIETGHLIKIYYKDMKEVFVELINDSKPAKVTVTFQKYPEVKPIELEMLSECRLTVSVLKEKLCAYIMPLLEI